MRLEQSPADLGGDAQDGGIEVRHSHRRALVAAVAIALIVAILVAAFALLYPYLEENYFGPAPQWHTFSSVFSSSGQLTSESCTLYDLQPVLQGVGGVGKPTIRSVMVCTFHGATYRGYWGFDCNASPSGSLVPVNGSNVPNEGCVLGQAPLNHTFVGIFSLGLRAKGSIPIYSAGKAVANLTSTDPWKSFGCSLKTDNVTRSNGPISCQYQGVRYRSADVLQACDIVNSIQVGGQAVPPDSCNLERSDLA